MSRMSKSHMSLFQNTQDKQTNNKDTRCLQLALFSLLSAALSIQTQGIKSCRVL